MENKNLRIAICNAFQKTVYKCDPVCLAMCQPGSGVCTVCAIMAESIQKELDEKCLGNVG